MAKFGIGQAVRRVEDQRFVLGLGRYVDDIRLPGECHGVTVLSPHAHARIIGVDVSKAKVAPGVLCVLTGADVAAEKLGAMTRGHQGIIDQGRNEIGKAEVCTGLRKSEPLRFLKEKNFHFAHRSSNPICPATESVSAVGFPCVRRIGLIPAPSRHAEEEGPVKSAPATGVGAGAVEWRPTDAIRLILAALRSELISGAKKSSTLVPGPLVGLVAGALPLMMSS
jgi:hypothetical protein